MSTFATCPAGWELYNRYCDAFELESKRVPSYEAERQAAWRAWTEHKNQCLVCAGVKAGVNAPLPNPPHPADGEGTRAEAKP